MGPFRGPDSDARFAALDEVAAEHGVTPNQLVLAWLLHQTSPTMVPLTTTRTEEQYAAAMPALDIQLTDQQRTRLNEAGT
jgi:aryl-alcohol dehydrogenase-like predicted oxidoreductase